MTTSNKSFTAPIAIIQPNKRLRVLQPGDGPLLHGGNLYDGDTLIATRVQRDDEGEWWATLAPPWLTTTTVQPTFQKLVERLRELRGDERCAPSEVA